MSPHSRHSADEIETAAARWLARLDVGLSPVEQAEFERWRSSDPRHAAALGELESLWSEMGRPRRTGASAAVRHELATLQRRRHRRKMITVATSLAAIVFLGVLAPRWLQTQDSPSQNRSFVLTPERLVLTDGSVVELNEGAKIAVNFDAASSGPRRVTLEHGEAHFEVVAKSKDRPFIVTVGEVEVRAIGTAFNIDRGSQQVEVLVTEGSVEVVPPARGTPVGSKHPIDAGHRVVIDVSPQSTAESTVVAVSTLELSARLAWRNPRVEFSHAPLSEVVALVNRYSRLQFRIEDPELNQITLSGLFRADDGEAFARILERSFGIKVERRAETEVILRRAG